MAVRAARLLRILLGTPPLLLLALLGTGAIRYSNLPAPVRPWAAGAFAIVAAVLLVLGFRKPSRWGAFLLLSGAVLLWWWYAIPPSNDRNWQPDLAVLPWAEIRGDNVTVHEIRNCDYRTETDFTVRHYDRTFDLSKLRSLDLFLVYWGSPHIAHTMMSFGFEDGAHLCVSIETRKEVGEGFSSVKGFFKQYELAYVVADERDVVRLRTNYRKGEEVYLYRLVGAGKVAREVFLSYIEEVNRLKERPEWYRGIFGNCTTSIRRHTAPYNPDARLDWRMVLNGHLDEMLYERGILDRTLPFAELRRRSHVNDRARAAGAGEDFSRRIREGLPGMGNGT